MLTKDFGRPIKKFKISLSQNQVEQLLTMARTNKNKFSESMDQPTTSKYMASCCPIGYT